MERNCSTNAPNGRLKNMLPAHGNGACKARNAAAAFFGFFASGKWRKSFDQFRSGSEELFGMCHGVVPV